MPGFLKTHLKSVWSHLYKDQDFRPRLLGLLTNPFYFARKALAEHLHSLAPNLTGKTLDVGCGTKPYMGYCRSSHYIGLDLRRKGSHADVIYSGGVFPFKDASFDSVLTTQVLEHVQDEALFLSEIHRVLKPDGLLLITVPFIWDEHEQPTDFRRYSSYGIRQTLESNAFKVLELRKSLQDARLLFQMICAYIYKVFRTQNAWISMGVSVFLMGPFNVIGEVFGRILPENADLYLDNVILAQKISLVIDNATEVKLSRDDSVGSV